jgi:hypothetical protein
VVDESGRSGSSDGREQVVEELRRLVDALAFRAEDFLRSLSDDASHECADEGQSERARPWGWCPVCAVVAIVRGERPELTARMVEQLGGIVALLREALAEQQGAPPPPEPATSTHDEEPAPSAKVQKIAVRRVSGSVLGDGEPASQGRGC